VAALWSRGSKKKDTGKGKAASMHEGYMLAVLTAFGGCAS
jgi:hypothetical protein